MITQTERDILRDVLKNKGTTRDQVRFRINNSPQVVGKGIERLIDAGSLVQYGTVGKLGITDLGLAALFYLPEVNIA